MPESRVPENAADLREVARRIRVEIVRAVDHAKGGHLGGPLSAAEILAALFFRVMRIRPEQPDWPDRDRFILSKGHSSIGLYAAMALRGYFPIEELATFDALGWTREETVKRVHFTERFPVDIGQEYMMEYIQTLNAGSLWDKMTAWGTAR